MRTLLQSINDKQFDDQMRIPVSTGSAFELDQKNAPVAESVAERLRGEYSPA